jgi:hypothetical protein
MPKALRDALNTRSPQGTFNNKYGEGTNGRKVRADSQQYKRRLRETGISTFPGAPKHFPGAPKHFPGALDNFPHSLEDFPNRLYILIILS